MRILAVALGLAACTGTPEATDDTDKYLVTQTRMIWGMSAAFSMYPQRLEFRDAARQGVLHILPGGFDHLLFLLALVLTIRRTKDLVITVTLFTIAHSVTLALAAMRIVEVPSMLVELAILASIAWVRGNPGMSGAWASMAATAVRMRRPSRGV